MSVIYHTDICPCCGRGPATVEAEYKPDLKLWQLGKIIDEEGYCSDCSYWMNIYTHKDSRRSIRIEGVHYWLYDMKTDGSGFLPFGGRQFEIRRKGFENIEIVMMWYNAEIPEALREELYNNAEFVR